MTLATDFLYEDMHLFGSINKNGTIQIPDSSQLGELISVEAACQLLGVHRNTLYRLIRAGDLPAIRFSQGSRWRFRKADLLDWLELKQSRSGT